MAQSGKCNYVRPRTFREAAIKKSLGESITYQYTNNTVALFVLLLFFVALEDGVEEGLLHKMCAAQAAVKQAKSCPKINVLFAIRNGW